MSDDVLGVVQAHIAAFNAADLNQVMDTFADDAVFTSADQLLVGQRSISELFMAAFAPGVVASMELRSSVVQGDTAACELNERISYQGHEAEFGIAAFYTVRDGKLARVKVYREGAPT